MKILHRFLNHFLEVSNKFYQDFWRIFATFLFPTFLSNFRKKKIMQTCFMCQKHLKINSTIQHEKKSIKTHTIDSSPSHIKRIHIINPFSSAPTTRNINFLIIWLVSSYRTYRYLNLARSRNTLFEDGNTFMKTIVDDFILFFFFFSPSRTQRWWFIINMSRPSPSHILYEPGTLSSFITNAGDVVLCLHIMWQNSKWKKLFWITRWWKANANGFRSRIVLESEIFDETLFAASHDIAVTSSSISV